MAQYVSGNLGSLSLSVPNDGVTLFSSYWSESVLRDPHYYDNQFKILGQNIGELFNDLTKTDVGVVVKIATLKDGKYIGVKVKDVYRDDTYNNLQIWYSMYVYNADNTLYSNKLVSEYSFAVRAYQIKGFLPIYPTVYVDEEAETATLFILNGDRHSDGMVRFFNYQGAGKNDAYHYSASDFYAIIKGNVKEYDPDPWSGAGYAGIGGGNGSFDFESDGVALPALPTVDAVSTGFLQLFTGGLPKILELSQYMWSANFFDNIVKITANPMDIIMGLYMYPFNVPASNVRYVRAGNVITNIAMGVPDSQIFEFDCGEFPVPNFYGAYLDYEPFTKCEIFLPYCGTFPLSMDDVAGKTINVKYRVDLLTGVCVSYVIVDGTVKYNFVGTCAINIPISSRSFENVYNAVLGVVGSAFSGGSFGLPSIGSVAGAVTSGKNQVQHGGNCSGNAGYLGVQTPYLIFSVPRVAIPKGLNKYTGYPIFSSYKLRDLKGYTEIEKIHLENMGQATKEEIDKITGLLERGVIL